MDRDSLLTQIIDAICHVLKIPQCFGGTPYEAERYLCGLIQVAVCLETGDEFQNCQKRIWTAIRELTKDIPSQPSHVRCLCSECTIPEPKASMELLRERGRILCASVLTSWGDDAKCDPYAAHKRMTGAEAAAKLFEMLGVDKIRAERKKAENRDHEVTRADEGTT